MILRWLVATLHLLVLPLGLGAIWVRARALDRVSASEGLTRVFVADTVWGIAALLWIATGLWRVFGARVRRSAVDTHLAPLLARVSYAEAGLVILMVFAATAVARGYFH